MLSLSPSVISFHARKGGVGRSSVLANVAWALASAGKRVLVVDLDFDAPALPRFFAPFLRDPTLRSMPGLLDAARDVVRYGPSPLALARYTCSVEWEFGSGALELIGAGKQNDGYAVRAAGFEWAPVVDGALGLAFDQSLRSCFSDYDFVLLDARAGYGDVARLCANLADTLVVCAEPGDLPATRELVELLMIGTRQPRLFPLMPKTDRAEKELQDRALEELKSVFQPHPILTAHIPGNGYYQDVQFAYSPFFSFGPLLAAFAEPSLISDSLAVASCRFASYLAGEAIRPVVPSREQREQFLYLNRRRK